MKRKRLDSWAVTVERNGEQVVTIASELLAGRDLSDEDRAIIRVCATHLLSFVGSEEPVFFVEDEPEEPVSPGREE